MEGKLKRALVHRCS